MTGLRLSPFFGSVVGCAVVALALGACSTPKSRENIENASNYASQSLDNARLPAPRVQHQSLTITDQVWAGGNAVRMRHGQPLPERVERPRAIAYASARPVPVNDLLAAVSGQTNIPLRLGPGSEGAATQGMPVSYEGPLSGLLNQVANYYGMNWSYDGSAITLSRFETRVFIVEALPGKGKFSDEISGDESSSGGGGGGSSGGGGGGSSNALKQESTLEAELNFWDDIKESIDNLLGGVGTAIASESSGTITVTTTAENMRTIASYIEQQNAMFSRQIAINVEVYTVDLRENEDFNISFNAVMSKLAPFISTVAGAAAPTAVAGGASVSSVILDADAVGRVDVIAKALNSISDSVRMAQFPMTTLNNRTVARRIGTDRNYVSAISSSVVADAGTTETITASTLREGFTMQLTPRMLADGRILMQYSLSLIDILGIDQFTSGGGNSIQLPRTSSRVFVQQSMLRNGSTLLLGGFSQNQLTQASQGVGDPFNYLLGGGASNQQTRQMLFIAITPQEIDVRQPERI